MKDIVDTEPTAMDSTLHDEFLTSMDKALEQTESETGASPTLEQETGWFGQVKARVTKITSDVKTSLESFVIYRVSKEVCKDVALEEFERTVAKIIRGFFWKVWDKYSTAKEGTALHSFRHSDTKFWKTLRTCVISASFYLLSALFLRQADVFRTRNNGKDAQYYDFLGRACIKAAFLEAGKAIDVDGFIESGLKIIVGALPDIRKDIEEAQAEVDKAAKEANLPSNERVIVGVKKMPERGSGKGMAA